MKNRKGPDVGSFVIEIAIYAVLIVAYFYVVLLFLGGPLSRLFHENKSAYALASLGLIIGQGIALESVTSAVLKLVKKDSE